ncbi:beta-1,3-galactosyltransferase 1-like [Plakobranchus ocellatus]|uniref:Hexosyltransferase n=1 Tax=Plakobranchus ocellatus TaxID=259542 RepID=A0AAV4ATT3_9GAST|nr:beta-1,3-galactosyltransferase 1-like [Plakobranchus ocellatus]
MRTVIGFALVVTMVVYGATTFLHFDSIEIPKRRSVYREAMRNISRFTKMDAASLAASAVTSSAESQPELKSSLLDRREHPSAVNSSARQSPPVESILNTFHAKVAARERKIVNPHDYDYIHNVPGACADRPVELLVGVPSRVDSFQHRQTIRQTWGQFASDPINKAVLLFFLGSTLDKELQQRVRIEARKHGDIVQESFIDSYKNLSLKSVALVRWASLYCPDSTFVVKADDDMYINVPRLLSKLRAQFDKGPLFLIGIVHPDSKPFRDKGHKWFVAPSEYRHKKYPNYVSGTAYAMTTSAAMRLFVESLYVRPLYLEDVYVTGILADKASVPRISETEFSAQKFDPTGCNFKGRISGHRNTPDDIMKIHRELFDPDLSIACPQQGDLRLSRPPSSQGTSGRARARDRRVPADLRTESLSTGPPSVAGSSPATSALA